MKLRNKKKFIVAFLSLASLSIIYPINYINNNNNNNNNKETNNDDNIINNVETLNDKKNNIKESIKYDTLFANRYTQPIISYNSENSGFLGANSSRETIYWTGINFFNQWSAKLSEHPSVEGSNPILVSAIHSDTLGGVNKNLIFAIVQKENSNGKPEYLVLVYDAFTGSPIVSTAGNAATKLPGLVNATTLADGSVMTLSYDQEYDRVIYYYIDVVSKVKGDIGYFSYDETTKTINAQLFTDNWDTINSNLILNDNNIILSLSGFNKISTYKNKGIVGIVYDSVQGNILPVMFTNKELDIVDGLNSRLYKALMPNLNTVTFPTNIQPSWFQEFYTPQMIIEYGVGSDVWFRMKTILTNASEESPMVYYIAFDFVRQNSNDSFSSKQNSVGLSNRIWQKNTDSKKIDVWYDRSSGLDSINKSKIIYTYKDQSNSGIYSANELIFQKIFSSESPNATETNLGIFNTLVPSNGFISNYVISLSSIVNYSGDNEVYFWSALDLGMQDTSNLLFYRPKISNINFPIIKIENGFISLTDPETNANALGLVDGKSVESLTDDMLNKFSSNNSTIFSSPEVDKLIYSISSLEVIRNASIGAVYGSASIKTWIATGGILIKLESKIPFKIQGFNREEKPSQLEPIKDISMILSTDLTSENAKDYFGVLSHPKNFQIISWNITSHNNIIGSANINIAVRNYYDDSMSIVENGHLNLDATGFKTIKTTNFEQSTISTNVTVVSLNNQNIYPYILGEYIVPNTTITYNITSRDGSNGTIKVTVSIDKYYNDSLGIIVLANKDFELTLSGFITTHETTLNVLDPVTSPDAYKIQVGLITEESLANNFVVIANRYPNSVVSAVITETTLMPDASITAMITVDKRYGPDGLLELNYTKELTFVGFNPGAAPKHTQVVAQPMEQMKDFFPEEMNNETIKNFIGIINPVPNNDINYEIVKKNNISKTNFGGSINVDVTLASYNDQNGTPRPGPKKFSLEIVGFKSIEGQTSIVEKTNINKDGIYAQYYANPTTYYEIKNESRIIEKATVIDMKSVKVDNINGEIVLTFTIKNYFNSSGNFESLEKSELLAITGFKKAPGATRLAKKKNVQFKDISPSDFDIGISNWENSFYLVNTYLSGGVKTKIISIQKKSYNNEIGEVVLEFNLKNGFFDSNGIVIDNENTKINLVVKGFKITEESTNNDLFIIIASVGGLLLIVILIITIVSIILKKKHNKLLKKVPPSIKK